MSPATCNTMQKYIMLIHSSLTFMLNDAEQ